MEVRGLSSVQVSHQRRRKLHYKEPAVLPQTRKDSEAHLG